MMTVEPSKVAFMLIFVEMSIYITYYKDVMFSLVTLANFVGMLIVSREQETQEQKANGMAGLLQTTKQIRVWLIVMVTLNSVWLVVTLLSDFDSAFYRKAFVYKRRVDKALRFQHE